MRREDLVQLIIKGFIILSTTLTIAFMVLCVYVVYHFLVKFW